jgi:hypothetical protein
MSYYNNQQPSFQGQQQGCSGSQQPGQQPIYLYSEGQEQSEWVMVLYFPASHVGLTGIRFPTTTRRPYYVHTPSGYTQYEYPTTMTAIENGLYSRGSSGNCNGGQRQNGGGSGGEYYRGPEQNNFGRQRRHRGRHDEGGWNGYGGNN